jgi:hypothetical protein
MRDGKKVTSSIFQLLYYARANDKDIQEINKLESRYDRKFEPANESIEIQPVDQTARDGWTSEMQAANTILAQEPWVQQHAEGYSNSSQRPSLCLSMHYWRTAERFTKQRHTKKRQRGWIQFVCIPSRGIINNS